MKQRQPLEYAIVDIETTGGYAAGSAITEVAIRIHDGLSVVEQYDTLINPQCSIPLPIQAMTGITDDMVADSPTFAEVAATIHSLLQGRVFVAHNVNFDYSFLKHHLQVAGYVLSVPKLCTVRMSRKIRPGLPSYSLGRLCDALGIPISQRHRAGGDADATAILFGKLLEWDNGDTIAEMLRRASKHQQLPPHLPKESFDALPRCPGVYYFRDRSGKVVYVGKARNIRSRVAQHFSGHNPNPQRQHFLRHIHAVSCEPCGTELMALLLEAAEIKRLWPAFNRAQKRFDPKYALYTYEDQNGFLRLAIGRHGRQQPVQVFYRQLDAVNLLHRLIRDHGLHPALCHFGVPGSVFSFRNVRPDTLATDLGVTGNATDPAASPLPPPADYNTRVRHAIEQLAGNLPTFAIIDQGRHADEFSCIWVEQGVFYGMGHIGSDTDLQTAEAIKESLTRYTSSHYMMQLIYDYAARHPAKVWKPGSPETPITPGSGLAD